MGKRERIDHLEDSGMDGWILLRWIVKKWDGVAWTGLIWLTIGTLVCVVMNFWIPLNGGSFLSS